jgi:hypothetical protein
MLSMGADCTVTEACIFSVEESLPYMTSSRKTVSPAFLYDMAAARPPLWSSGQSSWLQIRRPGFDSRHYQKKKWWVLERGPLSLVSTTEELLDRKAAAPVYKTENTAVGIRHADHVAPSILKRFHSLRRQAAVVRSV